LGGRNQDCSSKPTLSQKKKKKITHKKKRVGGVAQDVGPEFKPQYWKKKKKLKNF
jgi:hypothetical protein